MQDSLAHAVKRKASLSGVFCYVVNYVICELLKEHIIMANPNPKHKFSSENQPPPRGKSYRTVLLEALKSASKSMSESEFITHYIDTAMNSGDAGMLREIFLRLNPVPKPVAPMIEFQFPLDGTPVQKIEAIISGIASGSIPADLGKMMAEILKTGMDVQETTELAARLERLEKLLEEQNAS